MKKIYKPAIIILMLTALIFTSCTGKSGDESNIPDYIPTPEDLGMTIDKDREGNAVNIPDTIERIISIGSSNTEILTALGVGEKIIAADSYSAGIEGISGEIPLFDMYTPDMEQITALQPDIIILTGMSGSQGTDPFANIKDAGICVAYIPSSTSIEGIKEDIRFIAAVTKTVERGESIIAEMENEIAAVKEVGDTITDRKTVYFEISAAPSMYSFGKGVFLHEMLEIIGANNTFKDSESWISTADEAILQHNPDVILTSVDYIENPADEIKARPGWGEITAVKNEDVYYIDTNSCNRPSQNIVKALKEMAKAVYPEYYS